MKFFDIELNADEMTKSEKKIADFILKNPPRIAYMTESDIGDELGVSIATVSRFWRAVGFKSIKDFKQYLEQKLTITPESKMKDIVNKVSREDIAARMLQTASTYLDETLKNLSKDQFLKAVKAIKEARTVYVFGPGPSESLADLLCFRLNRMGKRMVKMAKSGRELFESMVNIEKEDAVVIFGFVRMTPETHTILDFARDEGCTSILITDMLISEMIDLSDIALYTARGELWEFHSMVAPMALVECLIVAVTMEQEDSLTKLQELNAMRKRFEQYIRI